MQALKWALAALLALGLAGAAWAEDATKGTVTGILVAKDKASISVKAEGEKEAV